MFEASKVSMQLGYTSITHGTWSLGPMNGGEEAEPGLDQLVSLYHTEAS
jgi:hypothetical protein